MIIDKEVEVKIGNKEQIKHYTEKGYYPLWKKLLMIKIDDLMIKSNLQINAKCDICGKERKLNYSKYTKNTKNLTENYCCSNKCAMTKQENTCLDRYGVKYPPKIEEIYAKTKQTKKEIYGDEHYTNKDKYKKTCLERYGVDSSNKDEGIKEKMGKIFMEKYGVKRYSQTEEFKQKYKSTCLEKYGVEHAMQDSNIFYKSMKNSFQIKKYKNTDISYQGSYEKYFLELMDNKGFLAKVSKGRSYNYLIENKAHIYHSDYLFNNCVIEIKSGWTYNRNGSDLKMGLKNETKWQAVKDNGDNIIILKSKEEIKNYVNNLNIIIK